MNLIAIGNFVFKADDFVCYEVKDSLPDFCDIEITLITKTLNISNLTLDDVWQLSKDLRDVEIS